MASAAGTGTALEATPDSTPAAEPAASDEAAIDDAAIDDAVSNDIVVGTAAADAAVPDASAAAAEQTEAAAAAVPDYARLAYRPEQPTSLLDLPPDYYAVQVIALSSTDELQRFFVGLGVSELSAAVVAVDGELRYVLLLGVYETFAAAEQAAANPPATLEAYDPWIRRLGGLQSAMLRADRLRQQAEENSAP